MTISSGGDDGSSGALPGPAFVVGSADGDPDVGAAAVAVVAAEVECPVGGNGHRSVSGEGPGHSAVAGHRV
ncbi:hypothetical protein SB660_21830, partial [Bacillus sp. SIMBA_005]